MLCQLFWLKTRAKPVTHLTEGALVIPEDNALQQGGVVGSRGGKGQEIMTFLGDKNS